MDLNFWSIVVKIVVLIGVLLVGSFKIFSGADTYRKFRPFLTAFLLVVALSSAFAYTRLGDFNGGSFVHYHDMAHYYFGAKYSKEVGYFNLYRCIIVADTELLQEKGIKTLPREMAKFKIRKLDSYKLTNLENIAPTEAQISLCKDHFTDERWTEFKQDVKDYYEVQNHYNLYDRCGDMGYNGSPVWSVFARAIASVVPVDRTALQILASMDYLLLFMGFVLLALAFGLDVSLMVMSFFLSIFFSHPRYIHGSFLRLDWMALILMSLAFLKMKRFRTSAVFLALASTARLFPAFLLIGPFVKFVYDIYKNKAVNRRHLTFAISYMISVIVLISISLSVFGFERYEEYSQKLNLHKEVVSSSRAGLFYIVNMIEENKPMNAIENMALGFNPGKYKSSRKLVQYSIAFVLSILLVLALRRKKDWEVFCLSYFFIFLWLGLTVYYCVVISVLLPFFVSRHQKRYASAFVFLMLIMISSYLLEFAGLRGGFLHGVISVQILLLLMLFLLLHFVENTAFERKMKSVTNCFIKVFKNNKKKMLAVLVGAGLVLTLLSVYYNIKYGDPAEDDWQGAIAKVQEKYNGQTDEVIIFPAYVKHEIKRPGIINVRFLNNIAKEYFWGKERVWIITPRTDKLHQLIKRRHEVIESFSSNNGALGVPVQITLIEFTDQMESKFNMLDNLSSAKVKVFEKGQTRICNKNKRNVFSCSNQSWNTVNVDISVINGNDKTMIWAHPVHDYLAVEYTNLKLYDSIYLDTCLKDFATQLASGTEVVISIVIDGVVFKRVVNPNLPGCFVHKIDTSTISGEINSLEFRIDSEDTGRRHFVFNADIVGQKQ